MLGPFRSYRCKDIPGSKCFLLGGFLVPLVVHLTKSNVQHEDRFKCKAWAYAIDEKDQERTLVH